MLISPVSLPGAARLATVAALLLGWQLAPARADVLADSALAPASAAAIAAPAQEDHGPWFYDGLPYGSDALVNPVRLIVDGGFGTLQFDNRSNRLGDVRFGDGWHRISIDLGNPVKTIQMHGWGDFLKNEVLPISVNRRNAQYWPNYTLHLVGGGMSYVMMREWYQQREIGHPGAFAGLTLAAYDVLNEVVEADHRTERTTDAVVDICIFDPAGVWLFSHEGVSRFFSRRLHLRDWSTQPSLDPATGALENHGQNFSIKFPLPRSDRWSFFYYFGNHGEAGLSYARPDGSAYSLGGGMQAKGLVELGNGVQTADLVPSFGFFYDRHGSLLFSVTSANTSRYRLRVNAYPGLLRVHNATAGLFVLLGRNGDTIAGVHLAGFPIGLAGAVRH